MSLIVQKFGGTSVANSQKILAAARKAIRAAQAGNQVVVVVSAMGHNTDELIDLAKQITDRPPAREMDMLLATGEQVSVALMAMAAHSLGHKAVSLTGAQIGIRTDSTHTKARIRSISTDRLLNLLDEGNIIIAAGFQGIDENYDITTLGRGGSDTTAVALAAVLNADLCEIFTDVDGVYTTDPRVLPEARKVSRISYEEMLELASLGAAVMHNRSIEFAKRFSVPIHVRSSFSDSPGTIICDQSEDPARPVSGAALIRDEARITVLGVPDRPGTTSALFSAISACNITVDMIVQNVGAQGVADISFTVPSDELAETLEALDTVCKRLGARGVIHAGNVSKVSAVGLGMARQTGVATKMFRALADAGINIQMITTSEIKISVLVDRGRAVDALRAVHRAFELEIEPQNVADKPSAPAGALAKTNREEALLDRLTRMEDLTIDELALDESQGRVTIAKVPDAPGVASGIFERIAQRSIFVDMIVQAIGQDGQTSLSFTVPRTQFTEAMSVARELAVKIGAGQVEGCGRVAKLSAMGIGLRSHTGVANRAFQALSAAGINLEMISTSEVRVNMIVAGDEGQKALDALKTGFADVMK
jgi:aspartate kinase